MTAGQSFVDTLRARASSLTTAELVSLRDSAERVARKLVSEDADPNRVAVAWICWRIYSEIIAAR